MSLVPAIAGGPLSVSSAGEGFPLSWKPKCTNSPTSTDPSVPGVEPRPAGKGTCPDPMPEALETWAVTYTGLFWVGWDGPVGVKHIVGPALKWLSPTWICPEAVKSVGPDPV